MLAVARRLLALLTVLSLPAAAPLAHADPTILKGGEALLPATGLVIDLPAATGVTYHVSGLYVLDDRQDAFMVRDVVDEYSPRRKLIAGSWVQPVYFSYDAEDCRAVVAKEKVDRGSISEQALWGHIWTVRTGVFTFTTALGRRPGAILCRPSAEGPALVLYRILATSPETLAEAGILDDVRASATLAAASASFAAKRTREGLPLKGRNISRPEGVPPVRTVLLEVSGLTLDLPDDGYAWSVGTDEGADVLSRTVPFFPRTMVQVLRFADARCEDVLDALSVSGLGQRGQRAQNLPVGWIAGPSYLDEPGPGSNPVACHDASSGALLVRLTAGGNADFKPFHTLLDALSRGRLQRS